MSNPKHEVPERLFELAAEVLEVAQGIEKTHRNAEVLRQLGNIATGLSHAAADLRLQATTNVNAKLAAAAAGGSR